MPVIGGNRKGDIPRSTDESDRAREIGEAVESELAQYRATIRNIDKNADERKLAAKTMFVNRVEAIIQRYSPLTNGEIVAAAPADENAE